MSKEATQTKDENQYVVPCAIIERDGKVLLARKIKSSSSICEDQWELPGGTAPFGLSFEEGLKQKMENYLGTKVEVVSIYGEIFSNYSEEEDEKRHIFVIPAKCRLKGKISLNEERFDGHDWFTLEEARDLEKKGELVEGDIEFIEMALDE